MVRIKVFSLREILNKIIISILVLFIMIALISSFIYLLNGFVDSKAIIDYSICRHLKIGTSVNKIEKLAIKKSFPILNLLYKEDYTERLEQEEIKDQISHIEDLYVEKINDSKYRVGSVNINSYLKQGLDLSKLIEAQTYTIKKNSNILIYHTHTSESYTMEQKNKYEYSDYYRTEDDEYNVVGVGNSFEKECESYGMKVFHDVTKHDYPSYSGAYKASLKTIESIMKNAKYDLVFDIHRDALSGNAAFRPTVEIEGETVAKLMFVVGTNDSGLKHDNWMENLNFAIAIQQKANEMYPGLFRELHLSTSRYNQHVSNKALIIEVGATGNTLEEAKLAMKYFTKVLKAMEN